MAKGSSNARLEGRARVRGLRDFRTPGGRLEMDPSRRPDQPGQTFEAMALCDKSFELLDAKLGAALKKILTGNAGMRIKRR